MLLSLYFACSSTLESIDLIFPSRVELHAELLGEDVQIQPTQQGWFITPKQPGAITLRLDIPQCPMRSIDLKVSRGAGKRTEYLGLNCEQKIGDFAFRLIAPGRFDMGSPPSEVGRDEDELLHPVQLNEGFWMASTEITQSFFLSVSGQSPALRKHSKECSLVGNAAEPDGQQPVYCVSWYEALEFANTLSIKEGLEPCYQILTQTAIWKEGCLGYRLPTEAEWEYAAAANDPFVYSGSNSVDEVGWHKTNSLGRSHPVAQKKPNAFGLYDLSGNVSEWVWDRYQAHKNTAESDPKGPRTGHYRVIRGGNWSKPERGLRHADRVDFVPFYRIDETGFRLVKTYRP